MRGRRPAVPRVAAPAEVVGHPAPARRRVLGPGTGDNAAAALGLAARPGDVDRLDRHLRGGLGRHPHRGRPTPTGTVAGFADATGQHLPLVCTLNAARVLDAAAALLGVDHAALSDLALSAPSGADGLVLVPYLEGERTPNLPRATGSVHGLTLRTSTPAHWARAAVEGLLCGLADGIDAVVAQGVPVERVLLIGGAARSPAVQQLAPAIFGRPVLVPPPGRVRRRRRGPAGRLGAVRGGGAAGLGSAGPAGVRGATGPRRAGALRRGARPDRRSVAPGRPHGERRHGSPPP